MNNQFDELTKSMALSVARRRALKKFGIGLAAMALACFGVLRAAHAQTSTVCDPAGDPVFGNGKGGPEVPAWLDVVQATVSDAGDAILFTLTLNAPVPAVPAWSGNEEGGQFWWGWRITGDFTQLTFVKGGCILSNGKILPAGYFLDLIWSIQTGSFRARLLDDALCIDTEVPFAFSADRAQISMLVPKTLLSNTAIIPDPNTFQYFAGTRIFKSNNTNNNSFTEEDNAPDQGDNFAVGTWSASSNTAYGCP